MESEFTTHFAIHFNCMFLALRFRTKSSEILRIDYSNGTLSTGKALKQYIIQIEVNSEVSSEVSSVHFHLTYEPMSHGLLNRDDVESSLLAVLQDTHSWKHGLSTQWGEVIQDSHS